MSEEWGPWIEHDGNGCPVKEGQFVHIIWVYGSDGDVARAGQDIAWVGVVWRKVVEAPAWNWENFNKPMSFYGNFGLCPKITRYRIRKPRGLTILEELLENLPEEVTA